MSDAELSPDEVRHVARLARIALEDAEVEAQRAQLARILGHMAELDAVDVEGVEPTFHAVTEAPLRLGMTADQVACTRSGDELACPVPDLAPGTPGFGRLQTKAAAFQEYFEATGCSGQPLSSVGLVGPWWQGST